MYVDIVISCFPRRWQSGVQYERHQEEETYEAKLDEPPSVPKQDPLLSNSPAGVPESSGLPTTSVSGLQRPHPVPLPPMHRSDSLPLPHGWAGRSGGPSIIVNASQEKVEKKKKQWGWMSGEPVRSSGKVSDIPEGKSESEGSPVREVREIIRTTEQHPATTKDSLTGAIPLPAPPEPGHPSPKSPSLAPSHPPDQEIPLQFQDSTPSSAAEQAEQPSREDTRSVKSRDSAMRKSKASRAIRDDPLDVHQTILRYLKGSARSPITTIYDLANLITNCCANTFDQYSVPDAFQFLDFFERSIGNIVS